VQAADAADQDDDHELKRKQEREHSRADEGELVRVKAARQAGHRRADRERYHLVDSEIDANAPRRDFAVADRDEGTAGLEDRQISSFKGA